MTETGYQPHYRQIEQALRERISTLWPGERLPSDADLCAEVGVSPLTARDAPPRLGAAPPPPPAPGAAGLGTPAPQPVVHLRRLRQADGEPIALESAILIGACADAVMTADLDHGSLHETLGRAGFVLRRGTGTISAASATAEDAELLAIPIGDPLLVERRALVDGRGRPPGATASRPPA